MQPETMQHINISAPVSDGVLGQQQELAALIERFTDCDGTHATAISPLFLHRLRFRLVPPTVFTRLLCASSPRAESG